jgi:hypothetical protein
VAFVESRVAMRDSKRAADSPVLLFSGAEWEEFVAGVRDREFDLER